MLDPIRTLLRTNESNTVSVNSDSLPDPSNTPHADAAFGYIPTSANGSPSPAFVVPPFCGKPEIGGESLRLG